MSSEALAYTAGFLEADGCIHITNSGVGLRIANKHLPTLNWFKENFGGSVSSKVTPAECYNWDIFGPAAADLALKLLPYLKMKRKEAEVLLEFNETIGPRGKKVPKEVQEHRTFLRNKLKELRKFRYL